MISDIAKGIYDELKADGTLMAAVTEIYHVIAVQTATLPYITFGLLTDDPVGTFASPSAVEDTTWWLNVFSGTGSKSAADISKLVMDVMDNATLTIANHTFLKCVRDFIGTPIYNIETEIYQIPMRYTVWVDKT